MREYTSKEMKALKENPYTFKVTKHKLYFTTSFKEAFWTAYQAGIAPRKIMTDLGYDLKMFQQKQIDSIVQRIKSQADAVEGFSEGEQHARRPKLPDEKVMTAESMTHELNYLRQEVEFLKKIIKRDNTKTGRKA